MKKTTVKQLALHDISEYMKETNIKIFDENHEKVVVTASDMSIDREIIRLNKKLGLNKINYFKK